MMVIMIVMMVILMVIYKWLVMMVMVENKTIYGVDT